MFFLSKLFSRKKEKEEQKPQPRYIILNDHISDGEAMPKPKANASYNILDTKENMKLGLWISHERYNSWQIPHEDYPDRDKNGADVTVDVILGDFYKFPGDDNVAFRYYAKVLDKDINRHANNDDADFALYTQLQNEIKTGEHPEQAILLHTLLKVVDSDILTSPGRVTETYRQQQKIKEKAEKEEKERALRLEKEKYQQEQLKIAEKQKLKSQQKQEKISQYLYNMRNGILEK